MHFEFLIEDQSSEKAMDILAPMILGHGTTYRTHSYKGIGHIPKGIKPGTDATKRMLLNRLPKLLRGYGRAPNSGVIVVICDLDTKDKAVFLAELNDVLDTCDKKPQTLFCLAIEEFEAWYLGDIEAVLRAYPTAKKTVLSGYVNDAICGTWELLADAIYKGGRNGLLKKGRQEIGRQKSIWAEAISPHMDVGNNRSPSFQTMCTQLQNIKIMGGFL